MPGLVSKCTPNHQKMYSHSCYYHFNGWKHIKVNCCRDGQCSSPMQLTQAIFFQHFVVINRSLTVLWLNSARSSIPSLKLRSWSAAYHAYTSRPFKNIPLQRNNPTLSMFKTLAFSSQKRFRHHLEAQHGTFSEYLLSLWKGFGSLESPIEVFPAECPYLLLSEWNTITRRWAEQT